MSDKFKVGQPIWSIGYRSAVWYAGEVVSPKKTRTAYDHSCGYERTTLAYQVHLPTCLTKIEGFRKDGIFTCEEHMLRPRDPDQFKAADESFEWRETEHV